MRGVTIILFLLTITSLGIALRRLRATARLRAARPAAVPSHTHECYKRHVWRHSGPPADECRRVFADTGHATRACPFCTRYEALMVHDSHIHYCSDCTAHWRHDGRCTSSRPAICPWCLLLQGDLLVPSLNPGGQAPPDIQQFLRGPHVHRCVCDTPWNHHVDCNRPCRAALASCARCHTRRLIHRRRHVQEYIRISRRYMARHIDDEPI